MPADLGLYRRQELAADHQRTKAFVLCGSEESADAAHRLIGTRYIATSLPLVDNAWRVADLEPLAGREGLIIPDGGRANRKESLLLAARLFGMGVSKLRITTLNGQPDDWKLADWSGTPEEFIAWAKAHTKDFKPTKTTKNGSNIVGEVFYRRMSDIESRAIRWLWPGRIAKGKVSMMVGNPGLGKSQVCASITSIVTNGTAWPVGREPCDLGSVVILSAEDDPEDTIRPRLEAAGADLDKVYILDAVRVMREDGDGKRGFDLSQDVAKLAALLHDLQDAALVVIDPITAYLGQADSHKNAEVRALLAPLADMAAHHGVAVVAVSHLTKSSGMDALLRVQGSIGFAAAARAVWGVAKDKDNPARRLFMPLKNNLGTDSSGFAYTVEGVRLQDSDIETSHVMWENQTVTQTADEVFGQVELNHDERSSLFEAKSFLRELLREGPIDSKQIEIDARGAGHSMTTLRRAAKELNLRIAKDGFGKGAPWKWWPVQDADQQ